MKERVSFATTLDVRDTCICLHAQRAARALARRFDEAMRPIGLTNGQFSMLMALNRPEPVSITPLARLLAMDRTTLTAALKPLERDGLVEPCRSPQDGRSRLFKLTDNGHAKLARALPIWRSVHASVEASVLPLDADALRDGLAALA
ncbi:MAG TPA: MarR family transcriptional regulator [Candidimonas sp.]|nr:MarR family transcriptional regulator [Candidimonas sp.]